MSHGARPERRAPGGAERGASAPAQRSALLVLVAIAVGAVTLWAALRWRPAAPAPRETMPLPALFDSVRAGWLGGDRQRALVWTRRWAASAPRDADAIRNLGLAWHNLVWTGAPSARERSATRTSLERIVMEKRALALLDSSSAMARTPEEWARAQHWAGMIHANFGLATDALRIHTGVHARAPGATPALAYASTLLSYLRDPQPRVAPGAAAGAVEPERP